MAVSPGLDRSLARLAKLCAEGKLDPVRTIRWLVEVVKFRDEVYRTWPRRTREKFDADLYRIKQEAEDRLRKAHEDRPS
jgi:hypothetical protein